MKLKELKIGMRFCGKYNDRTGQIVNFHIVIGRPFGEKTNMIEGLLDDGTKIDVPYSMFSGEYKICS